MGSPPFGESIIWCITGTWSHPPSMLPMVVFVNKGISIVLILGTPNRVPLIFRDPPYLEISGASCEKGETRVLPQAFFSYGGFFKKAPHHEDYNSFVFIWRPLFMEPTKCFKLGWRPSAPICDPVVYRYSLPPVIHLSKLASAQGRVREGIFLQI